MAVDLYEYYDRRLRRENSYWFRATLNLILGLVTMVPIYFIAWKMFNGEPLFGNRAAVRKEIVAEPTPVPAERAIPSLQEVLAERARRRAVQEAVQAERQPEPLAVIEPAPASDMQQKPPPRHEITLSLVRDEQTESLPLKSPRLVALEGCPVRYAIDPDDGTLPATVSIVGPVKLYVELSNGEAEVKATTPTASTAELPFSVDRMKRLRRTLANQGGRLTRQLAVLNTERDRLVLYVNAPMAKPLANRGAARTRIGEIDLLKRPLEQQIRALEAELMATEQMIELAESLDGRCKLVFEGEQGTDQD